MGKSIEISDEVYRRLERERGDRSFNAAIAEILDTGGSLQDVTGQGIFASDSYETIKGEIRSSNWSIGQDSDEFSLR